MSDTTYWLEAIIGNHQVTENEPGVYTHTFTPPVMYEQPQENAGTLTLADIDTMLEQMVNNAREEPFMLYVSIERSRQIRHMVHMAGLYRMCRRPQRKMRKCHIRKVQDCWRKGMAHIHMVERNERAREEAEMQRLAKEQAGE